MGGEWQFTDFYDLDRQRELDELIFGTPQESPKETLTLKQYTDITILLDRSGSMSAIREPMESAYKEFLLKHAEVPSTRITLMQFDDVNPLQIVYQDVPIKDARGLRLEPRGNTPLLDAFCNAIDKTGERLSDLSKEERPDQVLFVVITDGEENASKKYRRHDVFNRVSKQREFFGWNFVYLGANQDAIKEAASFGIPMQWSMNYAHTPSGIGGATRSLMSNTVAYAASEGALRGKSVKSFSPEQRQEAEAK